MRRNTRPAAAACAAILLLPLLAACAPEPKQAPPEALTVSGAGAVYLASVCPVNDAWDLADVEVDRLRLAIARGESDVDTDAFARAMRGVASADKRAAERLGSKQQTWPNGTGPAVDAVIDTLDSERKQAKKVAKLDAADAAAYEWKGAEESAEAAAAVRAALELPQDASAACAAWAEQEAEQESKGEGAREDGAREDAERGSDDG